MSRSKNLNPNSSIQEYNIMKLHWTKLSILSLLLLCMAMIFAPEAQAQRKKKTKKTDDTEEATSTKTKKPKLSKEEKKAKAADDKALKKELSAFQKNLDSYRAFKQAKADAEAEASTLKGELTRSKEQEAQCGKEVEGLRSEIEDLLAKIKACDDKPKGFGVPAKGVYYVVQIGAFQQADVEANPDNPDFRKESADGFNKYIMGVFNTIEQADALRAFLMKLNFQRVPQYRPFIAPYRDGARISLEEALGPEEAEKRKKTMGQ
jgi:hypothetical protein